MQLMHDILLAMMRDLYRMMNGIIFVIDYSHGDTILLISEFVISMIAYYRSTIRGTDGAVFRS